MKRAILLISLTLLIFSLTSCRHDINKSAENEFTTEENGYIIEDDLLYRIYETGIKVPKNSKLIIDEIKLDVSKELDNYSIGQYVSCVVGTEGLYGLIGVVSNGDKIDLTSQIIVQTEVDEEANVFLD